MEIKKLNIKDHELLSNFFEHKKNSFFMYTEVIDSDAIKSILESKNTSVYGLLVNETIVTYLIVKFITLEESKHVARIQSIETLEQFRGKGYANELLTKITDILIDEGKTILELDLISENEIAKALYSRNGFVQTGEIKGYFNKEGKSYSLLHMVKYL